MKIIFLMLLMVGFSCAHSVLLITPAISAETGAAHRARAKVFDTKKEYARAIQEYQQAFALDNAQHLPEAALDLNSIGEDLYAQNRWVEAVENFQKALTLTRGTGSKDEAIALEDMGVTQSKLGHREEGLSMLRQSLSISRTLNDRQMLSDILTNTGDIFHVLGKLQEADVAWSESLDILHKLRAAESEEATAGYLASTLYDEKAFLLATKYYNRQLSCQRARGDGQGAAITFSNLGACAESLL